MNIHIKLTTWILLLATLLAGCTHHSVKKARLIEKDATLTCSEDALNRCAIDSQLQDLADDVMAAPRSDGNTHYVSLLEVGEDELLLRLHLIRAARESIALQIFIWDDDEVGRLLFKEMIDAAKRGVKVQLLLDQYGTYMTPRVIAAMATAHENLEIKLFNPIMKRGGKSTTREVGSFILDFKTLNQRMHNKLFVVDQRFGIVGGRNIQDTYFDYGDKVNFKDLGLLAIGPEAEDMYDSFRIFWEHDKSHYATELKDIASVALRLRPSDYDNLYVDDELGELESVSQLADSYSIFDKRQTLNMLKVQDIRFVSDWPKKNKRTMASEGWNSNEEIGAELLAAEKSIVMQTPYLIRDFRGIRGFNAFRKDKPDVEIKLQTNSLASTDMFFVYALCFKQRQMYLEKFNCKMFELKPAPGDALEFIPRFNQIAADQHKGEVDLNEHEELIVPLEYDGPRVVLHSKFFIVDEMVSFVGSHNFDPRATNLNTENGLIIRDKEFAAALGAIFKGDSAPQNSWVVAYRPKPAVIGGVSDYLAGVSSKLPVFDIWPFDYSANFDLIEGSQPIPADHPDFYDNYKDVGPFPTMGISPQRLGVRFFKAFGGPFRGLM